MFITEFVKKTLDKLKSIFLSGLFLILPIILTAFIVIFTYELLNRWLGPLRKFAPQAMREIPGTEFLLATAVIMVIGLLLKSLIVGPIVHWFEKIIEKIPLIRTIYSSSKTLVDFFNVSDPKEVERKVVLVQFPRKDLFNIGFLLADATNSFSKVIPERIKKPGQKYYKVFMPNSPNPTSGYFLVMPEEEIIHTDMTFDEAIKTIVSCGLITPESLKKLDFPKEKTELNS
jgi:uncharacterized membrane protein